MSRNLYKLLFIIVFFISAFLFILYKFQEINKQESITRVMDLMLIDLSNQIKNTEELVLTSALFYSENDNLKECLFEDNEKLCKQVVYKYQNALNKTLFSKDLRVHIHTKNLHSFFRTWQAQEDDTNDLISFRKSLQEISHSGSNVLGVELGRSSILIRGIAPIYRKNELIGSVEVNSNYQQISKYFQKKGIDFYVLLDKKYKRILNRKLANTYDIGDFIVVNDTNDDMSFLKTFKPKQKTDYIKKESLYFLYTPIIDVSNKKIGYYVLKFDENMIFE